MNYLCNIVDVNSYFLAFYTFNYMLNFLINYTYL